MSYYYISQELCPEINLETHRRFSELAISPLLFLWESFPALITQEQPESTHLPVFMSDEGVPMLGGRGTVFFSLFAPDAEKNCLNIVRDTLLRLDVRTEIKNRALLADGYMCGACCADKNRSCAAGALYYGIAQHELSRAAGALGADYMSLSLKNPGLSRSLMMGALRYGFELEYGKAEWMCPPEKIAKCL